MFVCLVFGNAAGRADDASGCPLVGARRLDHDAADVAVAAAAQATRSDG